VVEIEESRAALLQRAAADANDRFPNP